MRPRADRLVTQNNQELLKLFAFLFNGGSIRFLRLLIGFQFLPSLHVIANLFVGLTESVMGFAETWVCFNGLFVGANGPPGIAPLGVQNRQLQMRLAELRIDLYRVFEQPFGLFGVRRILGPPGALPKNQRIVIISERVARLVVRKPREFLQAAGP